MPGVHLLYLPRSAPLHLRSHGRALAGAPRRQRRSCVRAAVAARGRALAEVLEADGDWSCQPCRAHLGAPAARCRCGARLARSRADRAGGGRDRSPLRQVRAPAAAPGEPAIVSRAGWGRSSRCAAQSRATPTRCAWCSSTTPTRPTAIRPRKCADDRPLDLHLPRALERLERHRLAFSSTPTAASSKVAPHGIDRPVIGAQTGASTTAASASP